MPGSVGHRSTSWLIKQSRRPDSARAGFLLLGQMQEDKQYLMQCRVTVSKQTIADLVESLEAFLHPESWKRSGLEE